jgi:formyltetrahydrofolate hydrolase
MDPSPHAPRATAPSEWVPTLAYPDRPGTVFEGTRFLLERNRNSVKRQQFADAVTRRVFMRVQFRQNGSQVAHDADLRRDFNQNRVMLDGGRTVAFP